MKKIHLNDGVLPHNTEAPAWPYAHNTDPPPYVFYRGRLFARIDEWMVDDQKQRRRVYLPVPSVE